MLNEGHEVVVLDNFDDFYDERIKRTNIEAACENDRFTLIEGDIRDRSAIQLALTPTPDTIVHLAARAGVRPSIERPLLYQDVNVRGTLELLEACRTIEGCRFIFASSSSVYGDRNTVPFRENDPVDAPISPYAATKRSGELLCHTYNKLYGMPITCLRFFTVYGPRQRPDLAIHKFARMIEHGQRVPVFGDGSMERDFTYIDDIVDGISRAMDRCNNFNIYNLGNANPVSVMELIAALEEVMDRRAVIEHRPLQPGDVTRTYADITRAASELGYAPNTPLAEGLASFVSWMRNNVANATLVPA